MNGGWHVGSAECMECMDNEETVQVPWLLTEGARLPFTSAGGVPHRSEDPEKDDLEYDPVGVYSACML